MKSNLIVNRIILTLALMAGLGGIYMSFIDRSASAQTVRKQTIKRDAAEVDQGKIGQEAMSQIQALLDEKASRTPAQQKIDSNLLYEVRMRRGERVAENVPTLATGVDVDASGAVHIDIRAVVTPRLLQQLAQMNITVTASYPQYKSISAIAPLEQLETLGGMRDVIFVQPEPRGGAGGLTAPQQPAPLRADDLFDINYSAQPLSSLQSKPSFAERAQKVRDLVTKRIADLSPETGSVNSQGDTTHQSNTVRSTVGVNGTNIKIGVISTGVSTLPARQASGDLPADVTVLPGQYGSSDEGTAMLEIVHDVAPGAKLYYADGATSLTRMAQNYKDLRAAGCDIILDDIFYFVESPFQDGQAPGVVSTTNGGLLTQAMYDVVASGGLIFALADNYGNKNDNRSAVYQGDFVNGGANVFTPGGTVHDFGGQQYTAVQTASTGNGTVLFWADPLGGSTNDYDLFVLNSNSTAVLSSSTNVQNGSQDPYEQAGVAAVGNRLVVFKKTGAADRFFHLSIISNGSSGTLSVSTEGSIRGHNTATAAISVAAAPAVAPGPFPSAFSSTSPSEAFTADGPRRMFFEADGTPFTAGNFSSTGGIVRQKPDITAADGVTTTTPGFIPFYGTSAATPHAGALAALVKSANPALTNTQIRDALVNTAVDIEALGVDRDTGAGIVMPMPALASLGLTTPRAVINTGTTVIAEASPNDGDGRLEPNERGTLLIQDLKDVGAAGATGVTATLSSTTPGVTVMSPATLPFSDMAAGGSTTPNATPYRFLLGSSFTCGGSIDFVLTVDYAGGGSTQQILNFSVDTATATTITDTLNTTAPVNGVNYTASTGTQNVRLNRNSVGSSCSVPKAFPGVFGTGTRRYDAYTFTANRAGCTEVTLTQTSGTNGILFSAVYGPGGFVPTNITSNYLADQGISFNFNSPGYYKYAFASVAGQQFTVVVNEVDQDAGLGAAYALKVGGAPTTTCNVVSTAASVSASGRVVQRDGRGVGNAVVTFTDSAGATRQTTTDRSGSYHLDDLAAGQTFIVSVTMQRFRFSPQVINLQDSVQNVNFIAEY